MSLLWQRNLISFADFRTI